MNIVVIETQVIKRLNFSDRINLLQNTKTYHGFGHDQYCYHKKRMSRDS